MKRFISSISLLLFITLSTGAQQASVPSGSIPEAVTLIDAGQIKQAKQMLESMIERDPEDDAAYYYLGMCEFYLGNGQDAEACFKEAVRLDPGNYWYKDRLAALYSRSGRPELTIGIFEQILEENPNKTELYYQLLNLYMQTGDLQSVMETLDQIELVSGKSENVAMVKYEVLMRQGKSEEAFKVLEKFNDEFSSPQILTMMGDAKLSDYEDSLALSYYQEALSYEPDYAPALLGRTEIYRMRRSYDEFFTSLEEFISENPSYPEEKMNYLNSVLRHSDPRFLQSFQPQLDSIIELSASVHPGDSTVVQTAGSYYFNTGRQSRAGDYFRKNVELYPDSYAAWAYYTQWLSYEEDWGELIARSEEAFHRFPSELAFVELQISAYYQLEDYDNVIAQNRRLVELAPEDTSVVLAAYSTIGDMMYMKGERSKAYEMYKKALKLNPAYAPVLNNYAYYLSEEGRKLRKAYEMSSLAVSQDPDNATYLDTLGWILFLQGKPQEAKAHFKRAMLYGGKESAVILSHYSDVLDSLGEKDLAKVYRNMAESLER